MTPARWVAIPEGRFFTLAAVAAEARDLRQVSIERHHVGVEPYFKHRSPGAGRSASCLTLLTSTPASSLVSSVPAGSD